MASGIVAGFFSSYVDYIIYKSRERLKKRLYYMHVSIIIIILGVINCFVPLLFTINSENIYSREPLILLGIGFVGVLMIYILGLVFLNRKKLEGNAPTIYVFVLLPFVTAVLQMVSYGLLIMWSGMALGVIIAYIFTETVNNTKDYLTKLNTRLMVGEYVERLIEKEVVFTVIMIDLDDYKSFNDNYGHSEGDKILINFSKLLSECFNENSIVSRFGGDEFVIVTQLNESNIHDNINDLISKISEFEHYPLLKEVKFSYGLSMNDTSKDMTFDSILDNADSKMYNLKAQHKNLKRRAND
jgi:diguanylate cyclase (GGDEF)-like protein